jgi:hypothetical protein
MKKLIIGLLALSIHGHAISETLLTESEIFQPFQDQKNSNNLLMLFTDNQTAGIWQKSEATYLRKGLQVDTECNVQTLTPPPFIYAHPLLLNVETTCFVNLQENKISFIGKTSPPKDNFSFTYLSEDEDNYYFLVNGRDYPHGKFGYVNAKIVRKDLSSQRVVEVLTEVPGLSGAIILDSQNLYYTMASGMNSNFVYLFPASVLTALIKNNQTGVFKDFGTKVFGPFTGLSFAVYQNENELLFYNNTIYGEYESYLISKTDGARRTATIPEDCELFGSSVDGWLFKCSAS